MRFPRVLRPRSVSAPVRRRTPNDRPRVQMLESRVLLTSPASGVTWNTTAGVLTITGTNEADRIWTSVAGGGLAISWKSGSNAWQSDTISLAGVNRLVINTGDENDFVDHDGFLAVTIDGGVGDDELRGGRAGDRLVGGSGNDVLHGRIGWDVLDGGTGDDELHGGDGDDRIFAGNGADLAYGGNGHDVMFGDNGWDRLYGENGNDQLTGGWGNDVLDGGRNEDVLKGEQGDDRIFAGQGADLAEGGDGHDLIHGTDGWNRIFGGHGNDFLFGGSKVDKIYGGNGNDTIDGLAGDDVIYGEYGDDIIDGNLGNDRLFGQHGKDTIAGNLGDDFIRGGADDDTLYGDTVTPTSADGDDHIEGEEGVDYIDAGEGDDYVLGGDGNDTILGRAGNDRLYGGGNIDAINGGSGNDSLFGGIGYADTLIGGSGADRLLQWVAGGSGEDTLADLTAIDAQIYFVSQSATTFPLTGGNAEFESGSFTEAEILAVDNALQLLHERTGSTTLLKRANGSSLGIGRLGAQTGGPTVPSVNWGGDIFLPDAAFANGGADLTGHVVRNLAYNWDDPSESGSVWVPAFRAYSGWTTTPRAGLVLSGDGNWYYNGGAAFATDFAKENPYEDFASIWELYFDIYVANGGGTAGQLAVINAGLPTQAKLNLVHNMFNSVT